MIGRAPFIGTCIVCRPEDMDKQWAAVQMKRCTRHRIVAPISSESRVRCGVIDGGSKLSGGAGTIVYVILLPMYSNSDRFSSYTFILINHLVTLVCNNNKRIDSS